MIIEGHVTFYYHLLTIEHCDTCKHERFGCFDKEPCNKCVLKLEINIVSPPDKYERSSK